MPIIAWDQVGDRVYETGLDRGVLYLPDGSAVPWNGLTSVIEQFNKESSPVYYDGMKINDLVTLGDFAASLKAVTYPDEFIELEGLGERRKGLFYADQSPQVFGLCYRTQIGNDADGSEAGYKIHLLYNVTAIPNEKTYASISGDPSLVEFEWTITAVPEEIPGFRPTAHIIINTIDVDPLLLKELELLLYGGANVSASLIPMAELVSRISDFLRFEIVDHGNGTWSAITDFNDLIYILPSGYFEISGINAWHLDAVTYSATTTRGLDDVPLIKIHDLGNGSWTATAPAEAFFFEDEPGKIEIYEATVVYIDASTYEISDTPEG